MEGSHLEQGIVLGKVGWLGCIDIGKCGQLVQAASGE